MYPTYIVSFTSWHALKIAHRWSIVDKLPTLAAKNITGEKYRLGF